ncbi:MAG: hypothetical protein K0M70_09590 [Arenimonas sp.]|uniref:hypothetical protein n=1 Tax=Arenimonas sp. TaxID=1872635 RepID=UPI0025C39772|nr:hypothetical protein [Arenimonas sp.]MBW8368096.1 hypothetical protein [Arenimonas sp.]
MNKGHGPPPPPPPPPPGDGVRVIPKARAAGRSALPAVVALLLVLGAVVAWRLLAPKATHAPANEVTQSTPAPSGDARVSARPAPSSETAGPAEGLPSGDPNDLANYFRPGDPEPTGAELIGALNDVGIRTGIGAFNPPGTSPPLEGLAVPEDYELPEGYVRHHQSSDDGVAIEPILMFAPDFTLYDANGRPIAMPENRVVPPELAPPGLPPRRVRIPPSGP